MGVALIKTWAKRPERHLQLNWLDHFKSFSAISEGCFDFQWVTCMVVYQRHLGTKVISTAQGKLPETWWLILIVNLLDCSWNQPSGRSPGESVLGFSRETELRDYISMYMYIYNLLDWLTLFGLGSSMMAVFILERLKIRQLSGLWGWMYQKS